jgi:hypothetical protein
MGATEKRCVNGVTITVSPVRVIFKILHCLPIPGGTVAKGDWITAAGR